MADGTLDLEDLWDRYGSLVLRRCRQLLRDEEEALDVCQDVFVQLLRRRDVLDIRFPSSLIYRIATNLCLNRIRDRRQWPDLVEDEQLARIARLDDPTPAVARPVDPRPTVRPAPRIDAGHRHAALRGRPDARGSGRRGRDVGVRRAQAPAGAPGDARGTGGVMSRRETQPTISDIRLERYRLGELPPDERDGDRGAARRRPGAAARLSVLEQSDREIAERYPAREMAEAIRRRQAADGARPQPGVGGAARRRRAWLVPAGVVATCVCVAAVAASIWTAAARVRGHDASRAAASVAGPPPARGGTAARSCAAARSPGRATRSASAIGRRAALRRDPLDRRPRDSHAAPAAAAATARPTLQPTGTVYPRFRV